MFQWYITNILIIIFSIKYDILTYFLKKVTPTFIQNKLLNNENIIPFIPKGINEELEDLLYVVGRLIHQIDQQQMKYTIGYPKIENILLKK